jgi:hypothetical protein
LPNYINVSYDHLILSRGKWQTRSRRAAMIAPSPRAKPPTRRRSTLSSMENWTFIRLRTSARVLTWSTRRPRVCNRLGQMTCSQPVKIIRTATSELVWTADWSLMMLVPPTTVPTKSLLPARSLSASTLIWLAHSRVGEMMTADGGAVAPTSRKR